MKSYSLFSFSGLLVALLLVALPGGAQAGGVAEPDSVLSGKKKGVLALPLLYYTPDTRFAYGVFGVYYFRLFSEEDSSATRLSYIKGLADYTQNQQLDLWSSWSVFLKDERYILKGEFRYRNFPDRFYGVGNTTPVSNMERYQYDLFTIKKLVLRKVRPNLFFGADYQFTTFYNIRTKQDGILRGREVTGYNGGINSGFGLVLLHDSRDNVINATRGMFFEASSYFFRYSLGSAFSYDNLNISYSSYHEVIPGHVLAFQVQGNYNWGLVPFTNLATAGGDAMLRGYAANRFRDRHFTGAQMEYRMPLFWRLGAVAFAGVGDVFSHPSQVTMETLKYSVGGGIRFMANRKERMNIRLDYGIGRDGNQSFYLLLTESF